jgi:hypothetical protein
VTAEYCLDYSGECFRSAKKYLDQGLAALREGDDEDDQEAQRKGLKVLARLAVANGVAVAQAQAMLKQGGLQQQPQLELEGQKVTVVKGTVAPGQLLPSLSVETKKRPTA